MISPKVPGVRQRYGESSGGYGGAGSGEIFHAARHEGRAEELRAGQRGGGGDEEILGKLLRWKFKNKNAGRAKWDFFFPRKISFVTPSRHDLVLRTVSVLFWGRGGVWFDAISGKITD